MNATTSSSVELVETAGNPYATLDPFQAMIAPYADLITTFWIALWLATCVALLYRLWREYREQRR